MGIFRGFEVIAIVLESNNIELIMDITLIFIYRNSPLIRYSLKSILAGYSIIRR